MQYLFFFYLIFISEISSTTSNRTSGYRVKCRGFQENCTWVRSPSFKLRNSAGSYSQPPLPSTTPSSSSYNTFSRNFILATMIVAGIGLGLAILRFCLFICTKSSQSTPHRHTSVVRPQVTTISHNQFKPDLPPAYNEAMATTDEDETKLPSYDELHRQRPEFGTQAQV